MLAPVPLMSPEATEVPKLSLSASPNSVASAAAALMMPLTGP